MSGGSNYNLRMTDSASPVVDLDLRLVGYFVVVAEQRHFGRAATVLRVAQPSLSRQVALKCLLSTGDPQPRRGSRGR